MLYIGSTPGGALLCESVLKHFPMIAVTVDRARRRQRRFPLHDSPPSGSGSRHIGTAGATRLDIVWHIEIG